MLAFASIEFVHYIYLHTQYTTINVYIYICMCPIYIYMCVLYICDYMCTAPIGMGLQLDNAIGIELNFMCVDERTLHIYLTFM